MMKLGYVVIAAVLLVGCRKEPGAGAGSGSAPPPPQEAAVSIDAVTADAGAAPDGGGPADAMPAADTPAQGSGGDAGKGSGGDAGKGSGGPVGGGKGTPGGGATGDSLPKQPKQGEGCAAGKCAAGLTCVEYYGIAGPRGPKFTSCEIPCVGGGKCPGGQKCVTIADGPGQVCRP